ncbi:L-threonylcarbamoyladenylate synthase [uncultured Streptococcus sp.]|uniref:L-threonylcarbamoyladenylate synthase n=1 Tax=uncultured Streptococcus sp. TaxID=83427 RepID=UPI0026656441|nr:L-threonylcarbamoyladenylate synthase [uncultured Streptococcus sp.]
MANLKEILENGGAVILPTETVYGLFAQAMNEAAVKHVYQLKRRPKDKAMNLNVADLETILAFSKNQPSYLKTLYEAFLPGPLTIILQANDRVPAWINSGLSTIGFRIPNHPKTLELIQQTGPLIGPSANISGRESGKIFADIKTQFNNEVTGLADDAALTGVDSTILDLSGETARILRQGAITKAELLAVAPELSFESN